MQQGEYMASINSKYCLFPALFNYLNILLNIFNWSGKNHSNLRPFTITSVSVTFHPNY